jgi:protein involved in polysaccharide export with SLBB domain
MIRKSITLLLVLGIALFCIASRSLAMDGVYFSTVPNEDQEVYLKSKQGEAMTQTSGQASDASSGATRQGGTHSAAQGASAPTNGFKDLPFFGESLFKRQFTQSYYNELSPDYTIKTGDRIGVNIWGAFTFDSVLVVDTQGNIFIPSIGPIPVKGVQNASLESVVRRAIESVYSSNYDAYVNLLSPMPLVVYVSGYVKSPGRYAGGATDSVLYFVDLAGGVDFSRGSMREIRVMRQGKVAAVVDLYEFIISGAGAMPNLRDGDTIIVPKRGIKVAANGAVRDPAWFEFAGNAATGQELMHYASPLPSATHVRIQGYRKGEPYMNYLPAQEFASYAVQDGDQVDFVSDVPSKAITVYAEGALEGNSHFLVNKGTKLTDLLHYIAVDRGYANLDAIHLRRESVAKRQKLAIDEALFRLEQTALTAPSATVDEAGIRVQEAEMIQTFVERARDVEPKGVVVVMTENGPENIFLEDNDIVVIPPQNDVVLVSGQVVSPSAVVYESKLKYTDYVASAGGFDENADKKRILIVKPDGRIGNAVDVAIGPGDHIMVLPRYDSKNFQMVKDVTQVLYQLAVGAAAIVKVWD